MTEHSPDEPEAESLHTEAVHAGEPRFYPGHALTLPITQTSTYCFESTQDLTNVLFGDTEGRDVYGRYGNPTVRTLEAKLAALEGTQEAAAFASGMAAVTTAILALTKSGSHVVLFDDCYRRTRQFVLSFLERFGVSHTVVPSSDLEAFRGALRKETRLAILEAPTNPFQRVVDLRAVAEIAKEHRVKTLVDTTFATPVNLRPKALGIDLVVHSATKYLGGHNDVLGVVVAGDRSLLSLVVELRNVLGGNLGPHSAYLIHRGLKTLALRVAHQNRSALWVAGQLEAHPRVTRVFYPGLPSHPDHAQASEWMSGFGGVISFELDTDYEGAGKFIDGCKMLRIAPSLGGVESLIEQPALMSYYGMTKEQRESIGIRDSLIRLAVGIERPSDVWADLLNGFSHLSA